MALRKLPGDVQSLLCASAQVNNYKTAIEELVYNSLDSDATSIAIRIHIQESTIQVIDNGHGITKQDFNILGQRYMTSKVIDLSTLRSAPTKYGYRGEFLANIKTISNLVKITSRHETTEETWAKTFYNGKEKKFAKMTTRPTKGTTVDIKGFLHNLNIIKRGIDSVNELQNIKSILEKLSLVHNEISLSLRDDSKNEIIFKIHKKRDIYQTLSTLFGIDKADFLELQVEKNEYKVKALIGKTDKELALQWIYLNRKSVYCSSKLHKIINELFKKCFLVKDQRILKSKKDIDEHNLFKQSIPFYFIFVTCPYIDYDISYASIDFKNWEQINKLLEKLVKFYFNSANTKEIKKPSNQLVLKHQINTENEHNTRDQVKKIMDQILGSNSKKIRVSQLQNGIKGKLVKRKRQKKTVNKDANILKLFHKIEDNKNTSGKDVPSKQAEINFKSNAISNLTKSKKSPIADKKDKSNIKTIIRNKSKSKDIQKINSKTKFKKIPTKKLHKKNNTNIKQKTNLNEPALFKGITTNFKILKDLKESDSVYKKSKLVAQKAEEFLNHYTRKRKLYIKENYNKKDIENRFTCKKYDNYKVHEYIPEINNCIINKYVMHKLNKDDFKTTYDLVQTILRSQQDSEYYQNNNISREIYSVYSDLNYRNIIFQHRVPARTTRTHKILFSNNSDMYRRQIETSQYVANIPVQYDISEYYSNRIDRNNLKNKVSSDYNTYHDVRQGLYSQTVNTESKQKETSYYTLSGQVESKLTYESHQRRNINCQKDINATKNFNKKPNVRFISKHSKDNFVSSINFRPKYPREKSIFNNTNCYDIHIKQTIDETMYKIEYPKSNKTNDVNARSDGLNNTVDLVGDTDYLTNKTTLSDNGLNPSIGNTYTIPNSNFKSCLNIETQNKTIGHYATIKSNELFDTYSINNSHITENEYNAYKTTMKHKFTESGNIPNFNVVLISNSQGSDVKTTLDNNVEPLNVCETILNDNGTVEREFASSFNEKNRLNDSLYNNFRNIDDTEPFQIVTCRDEVDVIENTSHHFKYITNSKQASVCHYNDGCLQDPMLILRNKEKNDANEIVGPETLPNLNNENNIDYNVDCTNFCFKNRLRFVPKGMSQIFENCRSKATNDYNMEKDYYEDRIYNNFASDVQVNSEIYEPIVQHVEDLTTKNIFNFQNKVKKDSASLIFDEKSLKEAKVLGQADCKFIAAIMNKRCRESDLPTEYLILFDQHAIHERIRLEKNLADYINEGRWTSVALDNITLKMNKDQILYLHNYKEKFTQLGLQWAILKDNKVTITSIPKAILGHNPREVEKVIKAVKHLIVEEINVIKLQKGCVSLYPKSIMELVFSEACRYAIKFGDQLSKNNCIELLAALSECKTPFQCAHGRPVMAVLSDIKSIKREYKVNIATLRKFKSRHN